MRRFAGPSGTTPGSFSGSSALPAGKGEYPRSDLAQDPAGRLHALPRFRVRMRIPARRLGGARMLTLVLSSKRTLTAGAAK